VVFIVGIQKIIGYTTAQIDDQYIGVGMTFTGSRNQNNPIRTQTIRAFIAINKRQSHLRTNRYNGKSTCEFFEKIIRLITHIAVYKPLNDRMT